MVTLGKPEDLLGALEAVVAGDVARLPEVGAHSASELKAITRGRQVPLVLSRSGVATVIRDLLAGKISSDQAQRWASFMRRGYVSNRDLDAIDPLDVSYEEVHEDEIADVVSRLDELGDLVDGDLSDEDLVEILRRIDAI